MGRGVKWHRSDDGFVESHCGRFSIQPLYWGCVNPQEYKITSHLEVVTRSTFRTQQLAKQYIEMNFI